jgi:hypothetical protein
VFHLSSAAGELARVARRQGRLSVELLSYAARVMTLIKERLVAEEDQAMHCTYGDGSPISNREMDLVRDAIWKNLVFFRWREGDVLAIDNLAVGHGRMPYKGPRQVVVAWA